MDVKQAFEEDEIDVIEFIHNTFSKKNPEWTIKVARDNFTDILALVDIITEKDYDVDNVNVTKPKEISISFKKREFRCKNYYIESHEVVGPMFVYQHFSDKRHLDVKSLEKDEDRGDYVITFRKHDRCSILEMIEDINSFGFGVRQVDTSDYGWIKVYFGRYRSAQVYVITEK